MNDTVLLVYEGEKTEVQIHENMKSVFFDSLTNSTILHAVYCGEIYQLYRQVKLDADLDLLELLRERNSKNRDNLAGIERKNISQVYLFFDVEQHAPNVLSADEIQKMVNFFDNETERGKIYLSYPMVEAVRDCMKDEAKCHDSCIVKTDDNVRYKAFVGAKIDFMHIKKFTRDDWLYLAYRNIEKSCAPSINQ